MPDESSKGDPTCLPSEEDVSAAPTSPTATRYGTSAGIVRYTAALLPGSTASPNNYNVLLTGGAHGATCSSGPCGYVNARRINVASGNTLPEDVTFQPSDAGDFGAAHLGVDLLDSIFDGDRTLWTGLAAGEELLVGDPAPWGGPGIDTGRVHWYHNEYMGTMVGDELKWDKYRWVEGGSFRPAGVASGAAFGASLAAPPVNFGDQVPWVAVGAPGESAIYILKANSAWTVVSMGPDTAAPFTDTTSTLRRIGPTDLSLPGSIGDFGRALLARDLNGDGLPELIIGAPGASGQRGRVIVLRGKATFPFVETTGYADLSSSVSAGTTVPDDYGLALAVGPLATGHSRDLLAIGAPGHSGDEGAVCVRGFSSNTTALSSDPSFLEVCHVNPFPQTPGDAQRFGAALATGNFAPLDATGSDKSTFAKVHELAVGTPGGREVTDTPGLTVPLSASTSATLREYADVTPDTKGTVTVFRASSSGPRVLQPPGAGGLGEALHVVHLLGSGASIGSNFGDTLFTADLQRNEISDLLVAAPDQGDGAIYITRSTAVNGADSGFSGVYGVDDSDEEARTVRVLEHPTEGSSFHVDEFTFIVKDAGGDPCTSGGFTGRATASVDSNYFAIDKTNDVSDPVHFTDLPLAAADTGVANMTISGDIWFVAPDDFKISFEEPRIGGSDPWPGDTCGVVRSPFTLDRQSSLQCE